MNRQTKITILALLALLALAALLSGCAAKKAVPPQETVYQKIISQNILPAMVLLDEESGFDYLGIDMELYAEQVMALSEDSLLADELLLFKAKSADQAKALEEAMQARLDAKAKEARTYSPEQYAVIQQGRIIKDGLYLALLVTPEIDALEAAYKDAMAGK